MADPEPDPDPVPTPVAAPLLVCDPSLYTVKSVDVPPNALPKAVDWKMDELGVKLEVTDVASWLLVLLLLLLDCCDGLPANAVVVGGK